MRSSDRSAMRHNPGPNSVGGAESGLGRSAEKISIFFGRTRAPFRIYSPEAPHREAHDFWLSATGPGTSGASDDLS
jgi:hypothetical protein